MSRNGSVVEFNPLLTALLGCNTNVSLLGSAVQAKAILCYLLLYVTKATNEITESLPLLEHARRNTEIYGSIASDRGSAERGARLFVRKSLNDISGRVEVSTTMAALCALGGEAQVFTHKFFYVFVYAAIRYAKEHTPTTSSTSTATTGSAAGLEISTEDDSDEEWLDDN